MTTRHDGITVVPQQLWAQQPRTSKDCPACGRPPEGPRTDRLTGLLDRDGWEQAVAHTHQQTREQNLSVALLLVDLDHFKDINDRFGHGVGDTVLQQAAAILRGCTREIDVVGRYGGHGGDEFLILAPDTEITGAFAQALRICAEISALTVSTRSAHGKPVTISGLTASVGIAVQRPGDGVHIAELIGCADGALLQAKRSGRDQVCLASLPGLFSRES
ncbi:diguanylate cyclase (GGDEF)-like protein [Crossiella equi]|uniref:Diguanylate cyclase (GGDEF)-like protein n=1 Tax=Crossiella equi TaxID=130796 RepID=A0ABS5AM79_9PSEU|nr:GGDEF domain-containing protein [Crossiella equi]MBP2477682.1 diguanylate cyclase (GGDEF)-like protein [Crossiella equi]